MSSVVILVPLVDVTLSVCFKPKHKTVASKYLLIRLCRGSLQMPVWHDEIFVGSGDVGSRGDVTDNFDDCEYSIAQERCALPVQYGIDSVPIQDRCCQRPYAGLFMGSVQRSNQYSNANVKDLGNGVVPLRGISGTGLCSMHREKCSIVWHLVDVAFHNN